MAISANVIGEIRRGGSDTNGGGFKTGASGTDWSQQDAAQYSVTDGVTNGTTTVTSATANFGTDVVGNLMYIQGGTGSVVAGWYEITARTNSTTITVDRNTGLTAGTGVTLKIGGAWASIGIVPVSANQTVLQTFVKYNATPYTLTSASTGVSGGTYSYAGLSVFCGYDTTRTLDNTDANRPTIKAGAASTVFFNFRGIAKNLILDANAQTTTKVDNGSGATYQNCHFIGMTASPTNASVSFNYCTATSCSATPFTGTCTHCEAYANTATGFQTGSYINCISRGNTGAGSNGFNMTNTSQCVALNCVAYGNGSNGFSCASSSRAQILVNCIAENNSAYGFNVGTTTAMGMIKCVAYNNTSGDYPAATVPTLNQGFISVTAGSVFTNAASNDFTLNNTASRGALLRATGYPASYPASTSTTQYIDIGVSQHQDSGGGGTTYIFSSMD